MNDIINELALVLGVFTGLALFCVCGAVAVMALLNLPTAWPVLMVAAPAAGLGLAILLHCAVD